MKTHKAISLLLLLLVVTAVVSIIHLSTRTAVDDGSLLVLHNGTKTVIDIGDLKLETVRGTRVNGKGEYIDVNAEGIALKSLLDSMMISAESKVTVISDDSYKAEISEDEIKGGIGAFLVIDGENELRLMVFGDSDSKRSVSDVTEIVVE